MMERNDIAALSEATFKDFVEHPPADPEHFCIRMTSGTTERPLLAVWHTSTGAQWRVEDMQRYIIAIAGPRGLCNVLCFRNATGNDEAAVLVLGAADLDIPLEGLLKDFAPDSFFAFPSLAAPMVRQMDEHSAAGVHTLGLSGERASSALRQFFSERLPNARPVLVFAAAETGVMSTYPCQYLLPNQYHPRDGVQIEIHEPDATGVGYLLISKPMAVGAALERYKIGDLGRIVPSCACGARITFEVIGRAGYDFIKLAGALLRREEFDRVALTCRGLFDDYRAEAAEVVVNGNVQGSITLSIFRAAAAPSEQEQATIANRFSTELFLTPTQTLQHLIDKGRFLPLLVRVNAQPFPQRNKDIKLSLKVA